MQATEARCEAVRFEIRTAERLLLIDGEPAKLGARAFDVLRALYDRRDRLVTKNELLEIAWEGLVVEENNLQVQISTLRKLLGPHAIVTIPGRGYRFTGVVGDMPGAGATPGASAGNGDQRAEPGRSPQSASTNLPLELSPLYGRETELAAVRELLDSHRVVTLVGAAGIGKTALAQTVAHTLRDRFEEGAWLIDLAPINDPALVVPTVARVLSVEVGADSSASALAERLRGSKALLLLDNCEHLLAAVAELAQALYRQAPGLRVLATSQEPLRSVDEQVARLDALALPESNELDAARRAGAVALFEVRARAADPRFALTARNVEAVVDICRHLDGVALALELAAARVPALGVDGLRARLGERFRVLTAGHRLALRRHQTLRAALDWSHGLLTPAEQAVFRRLGVFVGSFDLESARQVAAGGSIDEWAALDHLVALVDKSLVMPLEGASPRYRLLESTRTFALEKLQEAGETDATMDLHLDVMRRRFEQAAAERFAVPKQALYERYGSDIDDVRAALDRAARNGVDAEPLVALTGASLWLWVGASRPEGLRRSLAAIARIDATTSKRFAARLLVMYGFHSHPSAAPVQMDALSRGVELCREIDDRQGLFLALAVLTYRFAKLGRLPDAERCAAQAEALQEPDWPPGLKAQLLAYRAHLHALCGRHEQAWADKLRALHEYQRIGDAVGERVAQSNLADLALALGHVDDAVRRGREVLATLRTYPEALRADSGLSLANLSAALTRSGQIDEAYRLAREAIPLLLRRGMFDTFLDTLALVALRRSREADAARLIGRSDALAASTGDEREFNERWAHDAVLEALGNSLPAPELRRLLGEGAALTQEEAVRIALA